MSACWGGKALGRRPLNCALGRPVRHAGSRSLDTLGGRGGIQLADHDGAHARKKAGLCTSRYEGVIAKHDLNRAFVTAPAFQQLSVSYALHILRGVIRRIQERLEFCFTRRLLVGHADSLPFQFSSIGSVPSEGHTAVLAADANPPLARVLQPPQSAAAGVPQSARQQDAPRPWLRLAGF